MRNKSFAGRLSLKIIFITSAIFLLAIAVIAIRGSRVTERGALDFSAQTLLNSSSGIESTMMSVEQIANSMSRTIEAFNHNGYKLDSTRFFPLLEEMLKNNPYILGCGVYYEPYAFLKTSERAGVYVSRNPEDDEIKVEWDDDALFAVEGWDYFTADWYEEAIKAGHPIWIPPFIEMMQTGEYRYMTSYSIPLRDKDGNMLGVCAFDMSLEWLQDELLSMRPYPSSDIIILDQKGDYICNPLQQKPYEGNIYDMPVLKDAGLGGNILTALPWEDEGKVKVLSASKYGFFCVGRELYNGWIMIVASKYSEAFAQLVKIWLIMSVITLLGLIFLFFASRQIIFRESHPIVEFAKAAGKITNGHFDVPIPEVKHKDEISELGNALRYMQTSVTKYIEELTVTTSEKERLASELDVAKKIQAQMLSVDFPEFPDSSICASSVPARQVGGDLYDFYVKDDHLYFIVADVSGKGVPAALMMSISIAAFRAAIRNKHTMDEIVTCVNRVFCQSNDDMMFITAIVGGINLKTGEMEVCNAGHNPMVLIRPDGKAEFIHLKNNLACGVFDGFKYEYETINLAKGSRLIIYTDGVTEAEDCDHNQYGEDRLLEFAESHSPAAVASDNEVLADLANSVNKFVNGAEQFDDITMMSITV